MFLKTLMAITLFLSTYVYANEESSYKGQQQRDIKSLSQSDINGYLEGKGMGFAKAAELNHYPGPRHVLDISEQLNLDNKQLGQTQVLFEKMQANAIKLGKQLVAQERRLNQMFANGTVNKRSLDESLQQIGKIRAKLRFVHLSAHLEQKKLLNKHQIMLYDNIRGYGSNTSHKDGHNHSH